MSGRTAIKQTRGMEEKERAIILKVRKEEGSNRRVKSSWKK
jgi:hypothetical protein